MTGLKIEFQNIRLNTQLLAILPAREVCKSVYRLVIKNAPLLLCIDNLLTTQFSYCNFLCHLPVKWAMNPNHHTTDSLSKPKRRQDNAKLNQATMVELDIISSE